MKRESTGSAVGGGRTCGDDITMLDVVVARLDGNIWEYEKGIRT